MELQQLKPLRINLQEFLDSVGADHQCHDSDMLSRDRRLYSENNANHISAAGRHPVTNHRKQKR